jgi:large subunit ribosomal protein L4
MAKAKFYTEDGKEKGTRDLPANLFDCEVNEPVIHQAVVTYLANRRQGDASTKERSDVRGGGIKPFRQKGTGRARAGTIRSPLYRGGGVVFGPQPRSYRKALPKTLKRLALKSALSARAKDGVLSVVSDLNYEEPKTKRFATMLDGIEGATGKVLFVIDEAKPAVLKSARNIEGVRVRLGRNLTTYDVMWADKIVMTDGAVKAMEETHKS